MFLLERGAKKVYFLPRHAPQSWQPSPPPPVLLINISMFFLGESLQVIGERLTEHNGVIAVSGTFFYNFTERVVISSVGDPHPYVPYVFGPLGSVRTRYGSGSFYHQAK